MSNLYKQWFVRTENTRVINSDAILTEFIEQPVRPVSNEHEFDTEGFTEGLMVENTGSVIKAEPEPDYIQLAREEAEKILGEARSQAEGIVVRAEAEESEIRNRAQEEGYQRGQVQLQQELTLLRQECEASYQEKKQQLDAQYTKLRADMEKDLVDVILEVFNKVFHIQFDNSKEILMHLIENAILNIEDDKKFRIKVAESNMAFLESHKDEILDRVGHDIGLEILADLAMDEKGCVIETDSGVFDCGLETQLENLIKDIRSLCS